jgi:hypothetical protein
MAIPSTTERVPAHTAEDVNRRIHEDIERRVRGLESHPADISRRLRELDEEWDIERAIEANASSLAFVGTALGFFLHPNWLALPALVTLFLFQHALQGWCPPVPILRRIGFRTANEIERERQALKAIRGDYAAVSSDAIDRVDAALRAVDAK